MSEENLIKAMEFGAYVKKAMEYGEYIKKALSIAVNVGCGFEGDAEDAAKLLSLITYHESRIAELEHRNKVLEDACEMLRKENGRVTQLLDFWKGLSTNGSKVQE